MLRPRHRVLLNALGLAACAAIGTSLLSAPASSATSEAAGRPAPTQLSAQAVAARQQPLLEVANEIMQVTGQGKAAGYSGYGDIAISVPKRLVTLYWHGPLPSALRLQLVRLRPTAPVQVVAAPYTWQELEAQTHQIASHQAGLRAKGYTLARVGPEPGATGLQVGVDYGRSPALATGPAAASVSAQAASAQAQVRRLVPGAVPVTISNTPLAHATGSRDLDTSPWWGGSRIVRPGQFLCSSGFSVIRGSTRYMVTAGHCGGINTPWQTGDIYGAGIVMGTEIARNPCCDSAIIKVGANEGHIYDKAWDSSTGEAVIGPLFAVAGTLIYTEGATSGVRGNIDTLETGQVMTFTFPDGSMFTAQNESLGAERTPGLQANAGGDSGGPVIVNSRTAGRVYAVGTISGGYGDVPCRIIDPLAGSHCYGNVWFEEMIPILNLWGASLVTG